MKSNKEIVNQFIQTIWNSRQLDQINEFIADDYQDYSFLPAIPPTRDGLKLWIENTSRAFDHKTIIDSSIEEGDYVAVRVTFYATHIGKWRNVEPTSRTASVKGFRFFRLNDGKIRQHWGMIDGEALQTALTDQHHGCMIPT